MQRLKKELSGRFFRANRQYLLAPDAVRRYQSAGNGKLQVWIAAGEGAKAAITVSRTKAAAFRHWAEGRGIAG